MKCLPRTFRIPDGPWCWGRSASHRRRLGREALMLLSAGKVSWPPPNVQPTPDAWTLFNFPGGDAYIGKGRGPGTVPPCQPSWVRKPQQDARTCLPLLFGFIVSHEPRQQEFSAVNLNRKQSWESAASPVIHGKHRKDRFPSGVFVPLSWEVSLVHLTARGPGLGGRRLSTMVQGCSLQATKLDSWLWKFNVWQLRAASGVQHFKKVN